MAKKKQLATNANGGTMDDRTVLEWEIQNGIGFHNEKYLKLFDDAFFQLERRLEKIETFCDLGAGTGVFAAFAAWGGAAVTAIDANPCHKEYFEQNGPKSVKYLTQDFTKKFSGHFDVIASIEVFEHIPDADLLPFVAKLAKHCKWFVFSSTPHRAPTDEAWGHVNVKSTEDWQRLFEANQFKFVENLRTPTQWTLLFKSLL